MGQDPDGGPDEAVDVANELQRYAREETRLGVPPLLNVDAVHGHAYATAATAFPNGLGAAATSDTGAVERAASVTAREVRATGAHRNYGPTVDVARDPAGVASSRPSTRAPTSSARSRPRRPAAIRAASATRAAWS